MEIETKFELGQEVYVLHEIRYIAKLKKPTIFHIIKCKILDIAIRGELNNFYLDYYIEEIGAPYDEGDCFFEDFYVEKRLSISYSECLKKAKDEVQRREKKEARELTEKYVFYYKTLDEQVEEK